jgi:hypothetical protein
LFRHSSIYFFFFSVISFFSPSFSSHLSLAPFVLYLLPFFPFTIFSISVYFFFLYSFLFVSLFIPLYSR